MKHQIFQKFIHIKNKDDEEINPKTGKCVKKCKEDEIRNLETGRCNKIKPPKALKPPKIPTIKK